MPAKFARLHGAPLFLLFFAEFVRHINGFSL